jgi:hypothetical protein
MPTTRNNGGVAENKVGKQQRSDCAVLLQKKNAKQRSGCAFLK